MKILNFKIVAVNIILLSTSYLFYFNLNISLAHPGSTDSRGCHYDRDYYHCH